MRMTEDFLDQLTVFLSSEPESIAMGNQWFSSVNEAIRNSSIILVLCTPIAIERPWINFEERYSKPHVIEKKKRPRAASNASS